MVSCHVCGRLVDSQRKGGSDYSDGRSICGSCAPTAVHSVEEARRIPTGVDTFFTSKQGLAALPVPLDTLLVELTDRPQLQRLCQSSTSSHASMRCPVGLTCTEEKLIS